MVENQAYADWLVKDQQVFSSLVASLNRDVLAQVASSITARELWQAIEAMFASQTRGMSRQHAHHVGHNKEGCSSVPEYVAKIACPWRQDGGAWQTSEQ